MTRESLNSPQQIDGRYFESTTTSLGPIERIMSPSPPNPISLPQEIIDLIVDEIWFSYLHKVKEKESEEKDTLRTFLLVSKSFRHSVLPYIFRGVDLTVKDHHPVNRLQLFHDLLESASAIPVASTLDHPGRHILRVTLNFVTFSETRPRSHIFDTSNLLCQNGVINALESLCRHASNLRSIDVHIDRGAIVNWSSLDTSFQNAFQSLVRGANLKVLTIFNIIRLPATFLKGTRITTLRVALDSPSLYDVEDLSLEFSPPNPADINLPDPPLEFLITDHSCPFGAVPETSPPGSLFLNLKKLVSSMKDRRAVRQTWNILSASPKLEAMFLQFHDEIESPPPAFNIRNLTHLRSLELRHNRHPLLPYIATSDESLARIIDFLDATSPMEHFEHLVIDIRLVEYDVRTDFFYPTNTPNLSQWEQLDSLLMGPKYPALRTVSLLLFVQVVLQHQEPNEFDNRIFLSTTIRKLKDEFPRLSTTDRILFDVKLESKVSEEILLFQ